MNRLVVEMDVIRLKIGLDDFFRDGDAELGKVAPQVGGEYAGAAVTAGWTRSGEIARLEDYHLEVEVVKLAQAQQLKSGEAASGSAADDAYTAVIFQPQICQTILLRPTNDDDGCTVQVLS